MVIDYPIIGALINRCQGEKGDPATPEFPASNKARAVWSTHERAPDFLTDNRRPGSAANSMGANFVYSLDPHFRILFYNFQYDNLIPNFLRRFVWQ